MSFKTQVESDWTFATQVPELSDMVLMTLFDLQPVDALLDFKHVKHKSIKLCTEVDYSNGHNIQFKYNEVV